MYISKQKLDEIKKEYSTLIMTDSDVVDAFNLVHDILIAEAEANPCKGQLCYRLYQSIGTVRL